MLLLSGLYFSRKISFLSVKFKFEVELLQKLMLSKIRIDSSGFEVITKVGTLNISLKVEIKYPKLELLDTSF